jgi:hypothetical protein
MHQQDQDDPSRGMALGAIAFVALVLAAEISTHLIDFGLFRLRIETMNANHGTSPVAVLTPAAVAVAIVSAYSLARRRRVERLLPPVLAVVLVLASGHIGERLPHWQVLLLPPLGLALALLWRAAARLDPVAGLAARVGCLLLVMSFGLHILDASPRVGPAVESWPYQVAVALKEGFKISGWLLVASGLAATAWGGRLRPA